MISVLVSEKKNSPDLSVKKSGDFQIFSHVIDHKNKLGPDIKNSSIQIVLNIILMKNVKFQTHNSKNVGGDRF